MVNCFWCGSLFFLFNDKVIMTDDEIKMLAMKTVYEYKKINLNFAEILQVTTLILTSTLISIVKLGGVKTKFQFVQSYTNALEKSFIHNLNEEIKNDKNQNKQNNYNL